MNYSPRPKILAALAQEVVVKPSKVDADAQAIAISTGSFSEQSGDNVWTGGPRLSRDSGAYHKIRFAHPPEPNEYLRDQG